jgi:hypothetical protein
MWQIILLVGTGLALLLAALLDVQYGWTGRLSPTKARHYRESTQITAGRARDAWDLIERQRREYGNTAKEWLRDHAPTRSLTIPPAWEHLQVIDWADDAGQVPVVGVRA